MHFLDSNHFSYDLPDELFGEGETKPVRRVKKRKRKEPEVSDVSWTIFYPQRTRASPNCCYDKTKLIRDRFYNAPTYAVRFLLTSLLLFFLSTFVCLGIHKASQECRGPEGWGRASVEVMLILAIYGNIKKKKTNEQSTGKNTKNDKVNSRGWLCLNRALTVLFDL